MAVVGVAPTGAEAIALADASRPDIILMDLGLPDMSGLAAGRVILERWPDAKVVALTALNDRAAVDEAMRIGFRGYLTKETPVAQFISAIRAIVEGGTVPPHLPTVFVNGSRLKGEITLMADQLSSREREVLELLVQGASGVAVADRLSISRNTVRTHVQGILTKLQVHSRLEAAAFALKHGIVTLPMSEETALSSDGSARAGIGTSASESRVRGTRRTP
jgi:two-component system, NarL family, response regulator LiaR